MEEENQTFNLEIEGEIKEANIIEKIEINEKEYLVYSIDKGNETSDILFSRLEKDEEGYDVLKDVTDEKENELVTKTLRDIIFN